MIRTLLIAAALGGLLFQGITGKSASAQVQGADLWYSKATITRKKKPNRPPVRQKKVVASLLTVQWNLLKRGDGNIKMEVDPETVFETGDQVRLSITANQNGFLYIIAQPEGRNGVLLFPDPTVNDGKNYVTKDKEYLVPYHCDDKPDPEDCWMEMTPPAGTEKLLVIFSREKITTLPDKVKKAGDEVRAEVIEAIEAGSEQKVEKITGKLVIPGRPVVPYATRVRNINRNDNEDLMTVIEIKHE
ncbi:MAG: DUF4384 domain-containing protein [Blastocatellia bacterium]|nr:DUF4384 domain-containing protein [Blastocatellia bacterium]